MLRKYALIDIVAIIQRGALASLRRETRHRGAVEIDWLMTTDAGFKSSDPTINSHSFLEVTLGIAGVAFLGILQSDTPIFGL
jgi:hypothetical protein